MTVQLKWTDADVTSARWAYLQRNPWRFIWYFRYPIVAIIISFIVIIQYPESWEVVVWLVLFDAATIAYQLLLSKRNADRRFKHSRLWQDLVSVTIDDRAIQFSAGGPAVDRNWADFSDIVEYKRIFMFEKTDSRILFLPKSGMNESQVAEIRTLITTYAKGRVKLISSL